MLLFFFCVICCRLYLFFFFFKQKTAYEMRISDWSSDVCSSDLRAEAVGGAQREGERAVPAHRMAGDPLPRQVGGGKFAQDQRRQLILDIGAHAIMFRPRQIGRASCRERVCPSV